MSEDWPRLGDYVLSRRVHLGFTTRAAFVAHLVDIGHKVTERTLSKVEAGERVGAPTLAHIEFGLGWKPGSWRTILAGGEPTLEPTAEAPETKAYPAEVSGDPFLEYIWDYDGADVSLLVKEGAVTGARMAMRVETSSHAQIEARRA